jgi:tRNA (cmo5U34)-methyltransferase
MHREWSDSERVGEYLAREIPFRAEAERLLVEAAPASVEAALDLGCGDGRLAALIWDTWPNATVTALDDSEPMLDRARRRFEGSAQVRVIAHDLRDRIPALGPVDLVVSGLAIHHLDDERKDALFREVHELLGAGGTFINLDLFSAPSERAHERFRELIGRRRDDPSDRLRPLSEELDSLRRVGFMQVDCWFKWRELAMVVGVRPG